MGYESAQLTPGDWLYDTSYSCTCKKCGERFHGPKRASMCWNHESDELKEAWVASYQEPKNLPQDQMDFPNAIWLSSGQ